MIRILFTGGGTGGHIYPILAVAEELQVSEVEIEARYFGAPGPYKKNLEEAGIKVSKILPAKLRRYFDIRNIIDILILLPLSFLQAMWKVFWFMPDVLFSKGGPGSLPVILACKFYGVPVIIHDSDSIMGLANKLAAPFAQRIALSFGSAAEGVKGNIAIIGNPIRSSLLKGAVSSADAKKTFDFVPEKPVILVIGGSQGAVNINNFMVGIAEELVKNWQVLHQAGIKNFDGAKTELELILRDRSEEDKKRYKLVPYFEKDMKDAYSAADIIISRASSGSIFEIAAFGKPSILIPLPENVVGPHQVKNAYEYAKTGAAVVIEEPNLKQNLFMAQLEKIFSEQDKLKTMSEAAKNFSKPQAARLIADEILRLAKK